MTAQTRLSAKGQVVIPKDVRDRLGLIEGTVFDVIERGGEVVFKQQGHRPNRSGSEAVAAAVRKIQSFYHYDGPPVSLQDMDRAVEVAVREKWDRKLRR